MAVFIAGRNVWPDPPTKNSLDLLPLQRLSTLTGGLTTVAVVGDVDRLRRYSVGGVRVLLFPSRYGRVGYVLAARREAKKWSRQAPLSRALLASDVWGGLVASSAKRVTRSAFVMLVQGEILEPGPEYGSFLKRLLLASAARHSIRRADAVRSLNEAIAEQVERLGRGTRTVVIGSRVDTGRFSYRPPRDDVKEKGGPSVLCVGALTRGKNQATLIRAVARARPHLPGIELLLAGSGPQGRDLADLANQLEIGAHVRFLGQVPHEDLPELLASADIFGFPSLSEGQPRAVLEAQSAGVPVIASMIAGHRGIVSNGSTGILLDPHDEAAWARALRTLAEDRDLRRTLSRNARKQVEAHDFDQELGRFAAFVCDVAETAAARRNGRVKRGPPEQP